MIRQTSRIRSIACGWIRAFLVALLVSHAPSAPAALSHANNFSIEDRTTHRILTVRNLYRGAAEEIRYALVPENSPLPELPEEVTVIRTPVKRVVTMETVHVGMLDAVGKTDLIVGAATTERISHPGVRKRIAEGEIRKVGYGQNIDVETLLLLEPDLILTTVLGDPAFDLPSKLARTGLPVVITAGYMEEHPLARAEWVKFTAAFLDADEEAETFFSGILEQYSALRRKGAEAAERPSVFAGAPYSGTWYVPGGKSFSARFIEDAGGSYLWSEDGSRGGIPLDTERVFLKAGRADIWLNPSHYSSLSEMLDADSRFGKFQAFALGAVYNRTRPDKGGGPNSVWERGVVRPDEVLADLLRILHPDLLPDHELIYYERLQ